MGCQRESLPQILEHEGFKKVLAHLMISWKAKEYNFLEILSVSFILRTISLCDKPTELFEITKKSITTWRE